MLRHLIVRSPDIRISGCHIALLLSEQQSDEIKRFFETVTANRGTRIRFVSSKEEALQWFTGGDLPAPG